jgi:hypothetical protein
VINAVDEEAAKVLIKSRRNWVAWLSPMMSGLMFDFIGGWDKVWVGSTSTPYTRRGGTQTKINIKVNFLVYKSYLSFFARNNDNFREQINKNHNTVHFLTRQHRKYRSAHSPSARSRLACLCRYT